MEKKKFNLCRFISVLVIAGSLNTLSKLPHIKTISFKISKALRKQELQRHSIIPMYKYKALKQDFYCVCILHTYHTYL